MPPDAVPDARHDNALPQPLLEPRCSVEVQGTGTVDIESDYLPRVVQCENGAADFEALKAQAVAARSYVYYRLATGDGSIADGQSDQVYSCGRAPTAEHIQAVAETEGEILMYRGTQVAAFYVAGAIPSDRTTCIAAPSDDDWSNTERYVTYNWETTGGGVTQTPLGWVNPDNHANRGCKSQNAADCLAEAGWTYEDMLLFFYGADIEHVQTQGACVTPSTLPHGCGVVAFDTVEETIIDDQDACFVKACAGDARWTTRPSGVAERALVVPSTDDADTLCSGRWRLSFDASGSYAVDVHIPSVDARAGAVHYRIAHGGMNDTIVVDQSASVGWVELGAFDFNAGSFQHIEVDNVAGTLGTVTEGPYVVFDAVRVRYLGEATGQLVDLDDHTLPSDDSAQDEDTQDIFLSSVSGCTCSADRSNQNLPLPALAAAVALVPILRRGRRSDRANEAHLKKAPATRPALSVGLRG